MNDETMQLPRGQVMQEDLTLVEATVLDMIRVGSFFGRQPSFRDMATWMGYVTREGDLGVPRGGDVFQIVVRLERKGYVRRTRSGEDLGPARRAIELIGPQPGRKLRMVRNSPPCAT